MPGESVQVDMLPIDPQEEIARLKSLLDFAGRDGKPSGLRIELDFSDGKKPSVCVTCPGGDEQTAARIAVRHLVGFFERKGAEETVERVAVAMNPLMHAINRCRAARHEDAGAVCAACLDGGLAETGAVLRAYQPDADVDDEPALPGVQP